MNYRGKLGSSTDAVSVIGHLVEPLIGPSGRVKIVEDQDSGRHRYVRDGGLLLDSLDIEHPVGQYILSVWRGYHTQYHTGGDTLLYFIHCLTRAASELCSMGIESCLVIRLLHTALDDCVDHVDTMKLSVEEVLELDKYFDFSSLNNISKLSAEEIHIRAKETDVEPLEKVVYNHRPNDVQNIPVFEGLLGATKAVGNTSVGKDGGETIVSRTEEPIDDFGENFGQCEEVKELSGELFDENEFKVIHLKMQGVGVREECEDDFSWFFDGEIPKENMLEESKETITRFERSPKECSVNDEVRESSDKVLLGDQDPIKEMEDEDIFVRDLEKLKADIEKDIEKIKKYRTDILEQRRSGSVSSDDEFSDCIDSSDPEFASCFEENENNEANQRMDDDFVEVQISFSSDSVVKTGKYNQVLDNSIDKRRLPKNGHKKVEIDTPLRNVCNTQNNMHIVQNKYEKNKTENFGPVSFTLEKYLDHDICKSVIEQRKCLSGNLNCKQEVANNREDSTKYENNIMPENESQSNVSVKVSLNNLKSGQNENGNTLKDIGTDHIDDNVASESCDNDSDMKVAFKEHNEQKNKNEMLDIDLMLKQLNKKQPLKATVMRGYSRHLTSDEGDTVESGCVREHPSTVDSGCVGEHPSTVDSGCVGEHPSTIDRGLGKGNKFISCKTTVLGNKPDPVVKTMISDGNKSKEMLKGIDDVLKKIGKKSKLKMDSQRYSRHVIEETDCELEEFDSQRLSETSTKKKSKTIVDLDISIDDCEEEVDYENVEFSKKDKDVKIRNDVNNQIPVPQVNKRITGRNCSNNICNNSDLMTRADTGKDFVEGNFESNKYHSAIIPVDAQRVKILCRHQHNNGDTNVYDKEDRKQKEVGNLDGNMIDYPGKEMLEDEIRRTDGKIQSTGGRNSDIKRLVHGLNFLASEEMVEVVTDIFLKRPSVTGSVEPVTVEVYRRLGPHHPPAAFDAVVIATSFDNLAKLQIQQDYTWRALLVNANIEATYRHKGYKKLDTTEVMSLESFTTLVSKKNQWLKDIEDVLRKLKVTLILAKGQISSEVVDLCDTLGIVTMASVPYRQLRQLSEATQADLVSYVTLATETHVAVDLNVVPRDTGWTDGNTISGCGQQEVMVTLETNLVQTVVIMEPTDALVDLKEQEFWDCYHRVQSVMVAKKLLPGYGKTEQALAEYCHQKSEELLYRKEKSSCLELSTVYQVLASCLLEYSDLVHRNTGRQEVIETDSVYDDYMCKTAAWKTSMEAVSMIFNMDAYIVTGITEEDKFYKMWPVIL